MSNKEASTPTAMTYIKPYPKTYTIYSKHGCPYCTKAKSLLSNQTPRTYVVECDDYLQDNKAAFLDFIKEIAGVEHRTFPMIFYDGKFIGGYTETQVYHDKKTAFNDLIDIDF